MRATRGLFKSIKTQPYIRNVAFTDLLSVGDFASQPMLVQERGNSNAM